MSAFASRSAVRIALSRATCRPTPAHLVAPRLARACTGFACSRPRAATSGPTLLSRRLLSHDRSVRFAEQTSHPAQPSHPPPPLPPLTSKAAPKRSWRRYRAALALLAVLAVLYHTYPPFRHSILAIVRCSRLMQAVLLDVWDYKTTFAREDRMGNELTDEERAIRRQARKDCHRRSAERMLKALKKNSGIYVKIGQHVAAVQMLPKEWTETLRPLQDQCFPTPVEDIDAMLRDDLGLGIDDLFSDFDPHPIGVASLAQVHRAHDRRSGKPVAVKVQHADLQEFAHVDMATVNVAIAFVKHVFPDFEFGWLGEEMNEMLPLEMNFRHEAANSLRCRNDFEHLKGKTSLYLPEVLWAEKRCLVMEFIEGARVDDLAYLQRHGIDRNQVSQELSRIFSQMVYLNGFFHADPHHGNLLIRPKAPGSSSPFNFDVCLLDHGQYFDIPEDLRVNYAHFWLSLMTPTSDKVTRDRKHYAKLVGNIDDDMYPFLESAITGRVSMESGHDPTGQPPSSLLDEPTKIHPGSNELDKLRMAVMETEGLLVGIFELLRRVPRRLLMILKLSDLQRSLDYSLATTHGQNRVYMVIGQYCAKAVWQHDVEDLRHEYAAHGLSFSLVRHFFSSLVTYTRYRMFFGTIEMGMDVRARLVKVGLWLNGFVKGGFHAAELQAAGLTVEAAA